MADSSNIALIGAGSIGRRHIEAMASVKEAVLVAIADPSSAADALGKAQGIPVFADAEQMLTEADIDAVIIATPDRETSCRCDDSAASQENGSC